MVMLGNKGGKGNKREMRVGGEKRVEIEMLVEEGDFKQRGEGGRAGNVGVGFE